MRLAAVVNNKQVKADPTIVDFNTHQHFLRIVIQATAEYVAEISHTGTHYQACRHFLAAAEGNLSFAYVVFFLYMFGFKFLEYRRAVRHNESRHLDMLWRENLASTRTAKANKVNYRQMSVILVYWGVALVEPLLTFYHNTRTIRWIESHVGWDMPIEKLNMWIKESVISNISQMQICKIHLAAQLCAACDPSLEEPYVVEAEERYGNVKGHFSRCAQNQRILASEHWS